MVRAKDLNLHGLPPYGPEPYASANSATPAWILILTKGNVRFKNFFLSFGGFIGHAFCPINPLWRGGVPSVRKASGISCCSVERAVRIRGGSADSRRGSVHARRRRGVVHLLAHGGVAELAYAGDLKSSAFGIVGSSPTAPTMRVMAPATGPFLRPGPLPGLEPARARS